MIDICFVWIFITGMLYSVFYYFEILKKLRFFLCNITFSFAGARPVRKLLKRGVRFCTRSICSNFFTGPPPGSKVAQVLKKADEWGGGGGGATLFSLLKNFGSRHGYRYLRTPPTSITSNNKNNNKGFHFPPIHPIAPPPPPPFRRAWQVL